MGQYACVYMYKEIAILKIAFPLLYERYLDVFYFFFLSAGHNPQYWFHWLILIHNLKNNVLS